MTTTGRERVQWHKIWGSLPLWGPLTSSVTNKEKQYFYRHFTGSEAGLNFIAFTTIFMASVLETNAKILSLTHLTELQKKNRKVGPEKSNGFLDVQSSAAINFRASHLALRKRYCQFDWEWPYVYYVVISLTNEQEWSRLYSASAIRSHFHETLEKIKTKKRVDLTFLAYLQSPVFTRRDFSLTSNL